MRAKHHHVKFIVATLVSLFCIVPTVVIAGECPENEQVPDLNTLPIDASVKVPSVSTPVTTDDVKRARYDVVSPAGGWPTSYGVAYVDDGEEAAIIEEECDLRRVELTSNYIPNRVRDYLEMGPLLGIIGSRREFVVGATYDSVMLRPEGRPHFRFMCDRIEHVAGIMGYHLVVKSVRYGNVEMEMVISPQFPLPLFIKEYTGANPIQITLASVGGITVASAR